MNEGTVWAIIVVVVIIGATINGVASSYFEYLEKMINCEVKK